MKTNASAVCAVAIAALTTASSPALAADDALAAIRREMDAMRRDYEMRMSEMEARLERAEREMRAANAAAAQAVQTAQAVPAPAAEPAYTPPPNPTQASPNAFNPAIGVVLNGFFGVASHDPEMQNIRGFVLGDEAGLEPRGFSLGESEVNLTANVDPYLTGALVVAFDNSGEAGVEEAYLATTSLPGGFTLKGGRFFSAIGYLNEHHAHQWSFSDASLPYRAFLGGQLGDDGVQLRWLAPADIFVELGAEWFRGDAFPAAGAANEGTGTVTAFAHAGGDIDESSNWLAGLSYVHARAEDRDTGGDLFTGTSNIGIASLVYKWAPGGNLTRQNLTLSGEFFIGEENGLFNGVPVELARSGWYAQAVYQFVPRWSAGVRYAQLTPDGVSPALAGSALDAFGHTPRAYTALLEFDTSEFGRFRLQYTRDESDIEPNDGVLFQYTITYGAHGAHRY